MLIIQKVHQIPCMNPLQLYRIALDIVMSYKFLGMIFTSDLSWSKYLSLVCVKPRNIMGLIYHYFSLHPFVSTLLSLWLAL